MPDSNCKGNKMELVIDYYTNRLKPQDKAVCVPKMDTIPYFSSFGHLKIRRLVIILRSGSIVG